ncbi:amino acid permease [Sporocytophaga myxococcoides]|uniref:amino acid permease n=1 Tax=Sporocytophaga myxococcoides TaxID=153721 RepID=UPI000424EEB5|nr:amino acid permease [Sporocytophaga myxococcoides]
MKAKDFFRKKTIEDSIRSTVEIEQLENHTLSRSLKLRDLTSFGIAAIVGAGIFSTIGNASASGGPAVSLLFVFTAIACLFSALCYAEFASSVPVAGSAYTYAYVSFGELLAWIIGWDLLMEYAIGNVAVAISWSDYFTSLLRGFGLQLPEYLTMDFLTASRAYTEVTALLNAGTPSANIKPLLMEGYNAWKNAPSINGIHIVFDFPAFIITALITALVYVGIKESKVTGNILVGIKLLVILLFVVAGAFYVQPDNWSPFAPNGISGVMKGVSAVFFAYIGFDAVSTTAEEAINPKKDLPKAMFFSLLICTILYVIVTLILTGMVTYSELAVGDPLAYAFEKYNLSFLSGIIAFSAVIAMTSVLLVFQLGQPRIWLSMSRDGLLPRVFARIHPKFKTPSFSTIVTGFVVALPAMFMNLTEVTDLCSIGTLFAFAIVCAGVMINPPKAADSFKVKYVNGKIILPILFFATLLFVLIAKSEVLIYINMTGDYLYPLQKEFPIIIFIIIFAITGWYAFRKNLSLIPALGFLINLYLMTELGATNWSRFLIWLVLGLIFYLFYGRHRSNLNKKSTDQTSITL